MSDCLVTGVLPLGVQPEVKRAHTVFVRPWMPSGKIIEVKPGARVDIIPGDDGIIETNPRDITWEEFMKIRINVGRVELVHTSTRKAKDDNLQQVRLDMTFGDTLGKKQALLWLRAPFLDAEQLVGRQILAVTNLVVESGSEAAEWFEDGTAVVLTVDGLTVLEPAKEVEIGYSLA